MNHLDDTTLYQIYPSNVKYNYHKKICSLNISSIILSIIFKIIPTQPCCLLLYQNVAYHEKEKTVDYLLMQLLYKYLIGAIRK